MYTYCLTPGRKMPPTSLKKTIVSVCALEASSVHILTSCHDMLTCLQFIAERISPFSRWFWKQLSCVNTSFMSEGGWRGDSGFNYYLVFIVLFSDQSKMFDLQRYKNSENEQIFTFDNLHSWILIFFPLSPIRICTLFLKSRLLCSTCCMIIEFAHSLILLLVSLRL